MLDSALSPVRKMIHAAVRLAATTAPNEWAGIPRPARHDIVHAPGPSPLKLLLFGGGPSIGYGTTDHDVALAGQFARALSRRVGRGVDLEVRVQKELGAVDCERLAAVMRSASYDAVLVTIGVQDAIYLDSEASWARSTDALIRALQVGSAVPIYFVALPRFSDIISAGAFTGRILDGRVHRMNNRLKTLSAERSDVHYTEFPRVLRRNDLRTRAVATYRDWGEAMVDVVGAALDGLPSLVCGLPDEEARQHSLDDLSILDTVPEQRFDRITALAQQYFHSKGAAISLLDHNRQWFKSSRGFPQQETPREYALCDYTIRGDAEFVVNDALTDPRFADNPLVAGGPGLRSYAGWPIDSPDGQHVGALCVFDTDPREFSDADLLFLRNLAMMAQNELARSVA